MRLMLDGKIPSKDDLLKDELIQQMVTDAETKGKESVKIPEKSEIIQAATAEDLKDHVVVVQMVTDAETKGKTEAEKGFEKDAIIQSLTKEEIEKSPIFTEAIAQKLKESGQTIEVIKAVTGSGNIKLSPEGAVSNSQKIRQFLA